MPRATHPHPLGPLVARALHAMYAHLVFYPPSRLRTAHVHTVPFTTAFAHLSRHYAWHCPHPLPTPRPLRHAGMHWLLRLRSCGEPCGAPLRYPPCLYCPHLFCSFVFFCASYEMVSFLPVSLSFPCRHIQPRLLPLRTRTSLLFFGILCLSFFLSHRRVTSYSSALLSPAQPYVAQLSTAPMSAARTWGSPSAYRWVLFVFLALSVHRFLPSALCFPRL